MGRKSYSESIRDAMAEEMRRDHRVVLWGLDVGPYGGAFGASRGLAAEFGPERVVDMPISEAGYTGAAVGAAATGLRPIVELQFSDWITIASDQLVNQAANMRYMFGGRISVPMVLRAPAGGYVNAAAQHSHMFESWFALIPGLKVVLPSTPADAKGLLKASIRDDNPVIFFEHKHLYSMKGEVPDDPDETIPLGKADIKRKGADVTIVTYSYMVHMALEAARKLCEHGIEVEVLDLRSIKPMDEEAILESAKKTGRVLVLQETWLTCSVASEVAAVLAEKAFHDLRAPVMRMGAKEAPVPFASVLEHEVLPQVEDIVRRVQELARQ
jgi:pyruvate/2-oxoglutarate/acetoin dehydrogenase E1 component